MKRFLLSIIICCFAFIAYSQGHKLDLSGGNVSIDSVEVKQIDANKFVIICDSFVSISSIQKDYKDNDTLKILETITNEPLFDKPKVFKSLVDKLNISFKKNHTYKIELNNATRIIFVGKISDELKNYFGNAENYLLLLDNSISLGDSCVNFGDTITYPLKEDSIIVSKWIESLSLEKNGKSIKDSLNVVYDSLIVAYRQTYTKDSVFRDGDTLTIKYADKKPCMIIFTKDSSMSLGTILFIIIVIAIVLALCYLYITKIKKRKITIPFLPFNGIGKRRQVISNENADVVDSNADSKQDIDNRLQGMIDALFKDLPKSINGLDKHRLFVQRDDVDKILGDIKLVEATNRKSLIEKCHEIHQFIEQNHTVLDERTPLNIDSTDNPENEGSDESLIDGSESDLFVDILSILEPLYIKNDDYKEDYLSKETIDKIRESFEQLREKINLSIEGLKEKSKKEIAAKVEEAVKDQRESQEKEISRLEEAKEKAEKHAQEAENSKNEAVNNAVKKVKESQEKEISRLKEAKEKAEKHAQEAEDSKKKAVSDAVKKEKENNEKEVKRLKESKEKAEKNLLLTTNSLKESQKDLNETRNDRDKKIEAIKRLEKAQEGFTRSLSSVPFAESYCKKIHELIIIGNKIQSTAYSLLDMEVDDPYFIMKALSKYGKMIDGINLEKFLTDVSMASKANFVFKDSALANFKEDNKDIDTIMKSYFFNQYLEKYINAIMVLNESMSGLKLLLPEVQSRVLVFDKYRNELLSLAKQLKITVLFVKVGDMAGENVDLKARLVDVEIGKPGQILEIENCIVYLADSRKPQTKIKVTIKQ